MKATIGLALIVLGLIVVLWSVWKLYQQKVFVDNALKATGVIVGYEYSDGTRIQRENDTESGFAGRVNTTQVSPIVEFTTENNELIKFVSTTSSQQGASEEVEVLYNPANPNENQLNDVFSLWGWVFVIFGFGSISVIIGLIFRIFL